MSSSNPNMDMKQTDAAMSRILTERVRQVEEKGYTQDHDDGHSDGAMAMAAACYAAGSEVHTRLPYGVMNFEPLWPWEDSGAIARKSRKEQLAIAGALIVAELERLMRDEETQ